MTFVPYIVFGLVALAAAAFVAVPVWRMTDSKKARALLAGAVVLFVLGIGAGVYVLVGQPRLALREAQGINSRDPNALVPMLIQRVRQNPDDAQAWVYLARIYLTAGDADEAAGAFGHAVLSARKHGEETPDLDTAYGEMLVQAGGGQVVPQAVGAFTSALTADPHNAPARYYLGMAAAQKGDRASAARYWQSLLDEVPANVPLHQELIDRLASLGATPPGMSGPGGAPDPMAMVARQAAELKADPNNPAGWMRLIRAYSVLGETDKAKAALATARKSVGADKAVKSALDSEAQELKLE